MLLKQVIKDVKKKSSLSFLDESFIEETYTNLLKQNKTLRRIKDLPEDKLTRSSLYKELIRQIRKQAHEQYGLYQNKDINKRIKLLEKLKRTHSKETIIDLLKTHTSSKERLPFYKEFWEEINNLKPSSILDLAAGLNPLSLALTNLKPKYTATELNQQDCDFLNKAFKILNIKGKAIQQDLTKPYTLKTKADLCLMLKTLDSLGKNKRKLAPSIIKNIKAKYLIVSFSIKTLSGRRMRRTSRVWFEKLLNQLNLEYSTFNFYNELFYIIKK